MSDQAFVGDMPAPVFGPARTIVSSIYEIDPTVLEQIAQWLEQRGIRTPISQVVGFQQFVAQTANVETQETTTSGSFVDLTTVGPQLTLGAGQYVFFWGFATTTSLYPQATIKVNNALLPTLRLAAPPDTTTGSAAYVTAMMSQTATLPNPSNTVKMVYRGAAGGSTQYFMNRWLTGLRYANIR